MDRGPMEPGSSAASAKSSALPFFLLHCLLSCFSLFVHLFFLRFPSASRPSPMPVTIAEMQADRTLSRPLSELTIHQLKPIPQAGPEGFSRQNILDLLTFSDDVVALWTGPSAIMTPGRHVLMLCNGVTARNENKRKTLDQRERQGNLTKPCWLTRPFAHADEQKLLDTFGREANSGRPFVRVSVVTAAHTHQLTRLTAADRKGGR